MFKSKLRQIVIPQSEHLRLVGNLAFLYGNKAFKVPSVERLSLVTGISMHDRGYGFLDKAPVGEVSESDWIEITRRGFYMPCSDVAADLIVKHHLLRLSSHAHSPARDELTAEFEAVIKKLLEKHALSAELFARIDQITDLCDSISFDFCFEQPADGSVTVHTRNNDELQIPVHYSINQTRISVSPWPFFAASYGGYISGYMLDDYPSKLDPITIPWELSL